MSICINQHGRSTVHLVANRVQVITSGMVVAVAVVIFALAGVKAGISMLLALIAAFAVGVALFRFPLRQLTHPLVMRRYGLWLSTLGWLLMLVVFLGGEGATHLWPGLLLGGLGAGIAFGEPLKAGDTAQRMMISVSSALALAATALIALYSEPGIERLCFALALPIDLALLGIFIIRIAENDEG